MYATVSEHNHELKNRLLLCLSLVAIFFFLTYQLTGAILAHLIPKGVTVIYTSPTDAMYVRTAVTLIFSLLLSIPLLFYHFVKFVYPEKSFNIFTYLKLLPPLAVFLSGFYFGVTYITPLILTRLLNDTFAEPFIELSKMINFTFTIGLIMGFAWVLPYITKALGVKNGILKHYRKMYVLAALLVTGVLSADPTPLTQLSLSVPLIISYEVATWFAK